MKTAISIPDATFEAAEQTARRLDMSRSQFYATAVAQFVADHRTDGVTDALNMVYGDGESPVDPLLAGMQSASLQIGEW